MLLVGVPLRDHLDHCLDSCSFNLGHTSPLLAEATALCNGLLLAKSKGFSNIFIEGDNLIVIRVL